MKHYWLTLTYLEDDEDDDKTLILMIMTIDDQFKTKQQMCNIYITINIRSTTDILTAINVNGILMIWGKI